MISNKCTCRLYWNGTELHFDRGCHVRGRLASTRPPGSSSGTRSHSSGTSSSGLSCSHATCHGAGASAACGQECPKCNISWGRAEAEGTARTRTRPHGRLQAGQLYGWLGTRRRPQRPFFRTASRIYTHISMRALIPSHPSYIHTPVSFDRGSAAQRPLSSCSSRLALG